MSAIDRSSLLAELASLAADTGLAPPLRRQAGALAERLRREGSDVDAAGLELAVLYRRSGRFARGAELCRRVLDAQPDNALAHHIAASLQQCQGDLDSAITGYRAAISLDATLAEAHYFLGNALQMTGETEKAAESYRNAIRLRPDYLEALSNLGAVLMRLHRFGEAKQVLENARRLYPRCTQVLCNLGDLALAEEDFTRARSCARAALKVDPRFFDAHHLLGKICRQQEDYDGTLKHFRRALEIRPADQNLVGSTAAILEKRGEFDQARRLLQPLVENGSTNPLVLTAWSALSRSLGTEQEAIGRLEAAIAGGRMDISARISVHSELGKQYDRLRDYPRAFEHYRQANLLERRLKIHRPAGGGRNFPSHATIEAWSRRYDRDYWQALPRGRTESRRPLFVVGLPRSGTTLTEQILASHPDIHGAGELPDIAELASRLGGPYDGEDHIARLATLDRKRLTTAARSYLETLQRKSADAALVVDKMPTNFWHLGLISLLFPQARVIHLQRDPRDSCLSMYFQRFSSSMLFTTDLEELAAYHAAYARIMEYWKQVLDLEILEIRYEELVEDQEVVTRRMIEYCGLDWNDSCLRFHETSRDVHTPSYDQVRQPMYRKSIGRWKNYEAQLAPLLSSLEQTTP
ncbi:MAG TPA: sulfotransferase family protein [Gammaproteobacteria bacterium]|nr:sulfotransferase family protein [Gammaproteobacteria bacterium]